MRKALFKRRGYLLSLLMLLSIGISALSLQGCQSREGTPAVIESTHTIILASTPIPFDTITEISFETSEATHNATDDESFPLNWDDFPPPSIDPATPIPPPMEKLDLPEEVLVWVLLGSDTEPPFIGRTEAIHLLFIHPRFSKASILSIPNDLYVYIPGYTMQRINTAYAVGGIETLRLTLAYNFGVNPSRFVLAHPGDFQWLVDDIDGIDVTVLNPNPQVCGGLRAGQVTMDGALALCYASYRQGMDEIDRMRRQQQLLQVIFQKFARDGNLIKLPTLYASYQGWIKTDISLMELMEKIPLALRLADPDRIGYYMLGWDQIRLWEVPGYTQAQVFLPVEEAVRAVFQRAIEDILTPAPLTNQVQTLEAQLTAANIISPTPRATRTPLPTFTSTLIPSGTITHTPTITLTPNQTQTLQTLTPIVTATPTPTATQTQPGYPYPNPTQYPTPTQAVYP
jgi:LCP family protein required for cell wall assembly